MGGLKTTKHTLQNWRHLKCKLLNKHEYVLENKYSEDILKIHCKKCLKNFGVNLKSATIFSWDNDMMLALSIYEKNLKENGRLRPVTRTNTRMKVVI